MDKQLHFNRMLYRNNPKPGNRYRAIAVVEKEQFEVRIWEGKVIQADPNFIVDNSDAEIFLHPSLKSALEDAEKEFQTSVAAGWILYDRFASAS